MAGYENLMNSGGGGVKKYFCISIAVTGGRSQLFWQEPEPNDLSGSISGSGSYLNTQVAGLKTVAHNYLAISALTFLTFFNS